MITLRKFEYFVRMKKGTEVLSFINSTRKAYPFSEKVYSEADMENVYLIMSGNRVGGFCEAEIQNLCIEVPRPTALYLHEIHIADTAKNQGFGQAAIHHLMRLGLPIEFVVANDNAPMINLIQKFNAKITYEPEHVKSYVIMPVRNV